MLVARAGEQAWVLQGEEHAGFRHVPSKQKGPRFSITISSFKLLAGIT